VAWLTADVCTRLTGFEPTLAAWTHGASLEAPTPTVLPPPIPSLCLSMSFAVHCLTG
jgi:hypothetical protein